MGIATIICGIFIMYNSIAMYADLPSAFLFSDKNFICAILHGCALKFSFPLGLCFIVIPIVAKFMRKEDTAKTEILLFACALVCSSFLIL